MSTDAYENAEIAEKFVDLVLNDPDEAKKLIHDDFKFRYMVFNLNNIFRFYLPFI